MGNFTGPQTPGASTSKAIVFDVTAEGTLTTVHSFGGQGGNGPYAGLVQGTDGNFYGATLGVRRAGAGQRRDLLGNNRLRRCGPRNDLQRVGRAGPLFENAARARQGGDVGGYPGHGSDWGDQL